MIKDKPSYEWSPVEKAVFIISLSVIITLALWFIPWMNYSPGEIGRGFPIVWYTKWRAAGAVAKINYKRLMLDFLITLFVVWGLFFEMSTIRRIREKGDRK